MGVARTGIAIGAAALLVGWFGVRDVRAQVNNPSYDPRTAFSESDFNHDGQIDHVEFDERMTDVFFHADANKDGVLSPNECRATLVQSESLDTVDSNHDGTLTLHEFTRAREVDFEQADTNDDGVLKIDEVVTIYERPSKK
jgi:Ca2+-binding EF-hand superfamily protein